MVAEVDAKTHTYLMAKGGIKKRVKERSNVSYMQKLIKKSKTAARGSVTAELNRMLTHLLERVNVNMASIMTHYAKKDDTVKAKLVQAAFQAMLSEELRESACDAGAAALLKFVDANKAKNSARAEKKAASAQSVEASA